MNKTEEIRECELPPLLKIYNLGRRTRQAAIEHVCDLCRHPIRKGQEYTRVAWDQDGKIRVLKYHVARQHEDECIWEKNKNLSPEQVGA